VVYLAFLAIFRLLPVPPVFLPETLFEWIVLGPVAMTGLGLAGLAGILSLGEERTSGTFAWHMTLPISGRQWLIKLVVAMVSGLACSILLPVLTMMAGGSIYGSPFLFVHLSAMWEDLIFMPILILACFWCACAANGTVRAATWAMPAIAAVPFTTVGGVWLGRELGERPQARSKIWPFPPSTSARWRSPASSTLPIPTCSGSLSRPCSPHCSKVTGSSGRRHKIALCGC